MALLEVSCTCLFLRIWGYSLLFYLLIVSKVDAMEFLLNSSLVVESWRRQWHHSSTLAWKVPWMEEPGRVQSMGLLRVRHD